MNIPKLKQLTAFLALAYAILLPQIAVSQAVNTAISPTSKYTYNDLNQYTAFLKKLATAYSNTIDPKLQKEYLNIITEKNTGLIKEFDDKSFLFDDQVYPYLSAVFNYILDKNALDKTRFHFFVNRIPSVNAYSYEEGTIVCNLGLVNIMDNESELAMVFCHELGHYLLGHGNLGIVSRLQTYHCAAFLDQMKKIRKQEFGARTKLEELYKNDVFDNRRHNRAQERAADSLGMVLFRNTGYDGTQVSHVFDLLAASEKSGTNGIVKNFFKQEALPFEDRWFQPIQKISFGTVDKATVDSLKTHPDCAVRKVVMQAYFDRNPKHGVDFIVADAEKLTRIKKTALFEEAAFSKEKDKLSFYFYQLIQNSNSYPSDDYIKSEIFNTLASLCRHQKDHTFHAVVGIQYIPDDDQDEYALLLKMFDNADLAALAGIALKYYNNHTTSINTSAEVINNLKQFKN